MKASTKRPKSSKTRTSKKTAPRTTRVEPVVPEPQPVPEMPVFSAPETVAAPKFNPWSLAVTALILVALVVGGFVKRNRDQMTELKSKTIPSAIAKLAGSMKVKDIRNVKEVSGVYEFEVAFDVNGQEQKYTSYITKDGKIVFTAGTKVADLSAKTVAKDAPKMTCSDLVKGNGTLTAYVVSQCPYGLQMQRAMKVAIDAKPELAKTFAVKYIGSIKDGKIQSMHGDKEAEENLRQICIRDEQADKYWSYVGCYMKEGKGDECAAAASVNQAQLTACTTDASRGLAYAQKDFDVANKYNVGGSPTLLANGDQTVSEYDFGGRTPDALKQLVCCSSKTQPEFCKADLSKEAVAVAFSVSDAAGSASTGAASCGN